MIDLPVGGAQRCLFSNGRGRRAPGMNAKAWMGVALVVGLTPMAQAENVPLYVTGSQTVTHESNLFRESSNPDADTSYQTGVRAGFDKSYGRQNYRASGTAFVNRFAQNTDLNYNGYQADASISSQALDNWLGRVSLSDARSLAPYDVASANAFTGRNIQTSRTVSSFLRYGLYGRWSVNGTLSRYDQDYTLQGYYYPKITRNTFGADLRYAPSDLVSYSFGYRESPGRTFPASLNEDVEDKTRSRSLDFNGSWTATGLSRLDAVVSLTRDKHTFDDLKSSSVTGRVNWTYTPHGLLTYQLNLRRYTGNSAQDATSLKNIDITYSNGSVVTELGGEITWSLTGKVKLNTSASYSQTKTSTEYIAGGSSSIPRSATSNSANAGVGLTYTPLRWLTFDCDVRRYQRTAGLFSRSYEATAFGCTGSVTLNGQD